MDQNIELLRRQTKEFIDNDPTVVVLTGKEKVRKPGGGYIFDDGVVRPPQTVKMIWPGGITSGIFKNFDGQDVQYDMIMVAEFGADVKIGDYWIDGDNKYIIEGFAPDNFYELKAAITTYGVCPIGG